MTGSVARSILDGCTRMRPTAATGLVLTKIELQPVGRQMLATADHVAS